MYFQRTGYYVNQAAFTVTAAPTTVNGSLLPGGPVLQGTVKDANTQAGIVGAEVVLGSNGSVFFQRNDTETTTGGAYVFDSSVIYDTAASGFTLNVVEVSATDYFKFQSSSVLQVNPPYPVIQDVSLVPASGMVLEGVVTDRSTGNPVAGVSVFSSNSPSVLLTTTDGSGSYSLTGQQIGDRAAGRCISSGPATT